MLNSRSRVYRPKIVTIDEFPLRGFFLCPKCSKKLTGSKCKGRNKFYYYYHCENSCKYRINSENANSIFINNLKNYLPLDPVVKLYSKVILETYNGHTSAARSEKTQIVSQLSSYEKRLSTARERIKNKTWGTIIKYSDICKKKA